MSSHSSSTSPTPAPSSPRTPPPMSPNFKLTLPTPPSFAAHRSSASHSRSNSRNASSTNLVDLNRDHHNDNDSNGVSGHTKRFSISSVDDPIVYNNNNNEKKDRRVSFSKDTQSISRPLIMNIHKDASSIDGSGMKSPVYKIPQRQINNKITEEQDHDNDKEEILNSPNANTDLPATPSSTAKRRPISFQGISPSLSNKTSPSRFASMAASKGISIAPSLSKSSSGAAFQRSIWSAGIIPTTKSGWISPLNNTTSTSTSNMVQSYAKSISSTLKSPIPIALKSPLKSPLNTVSTTGKGETATEIAKARGLSIAIIKENGKGVVVPVTPGLPSAGGGLKSPTGLITSLKSPEIKILSNVDSNGGLQSAKSTGIPDTAGSGGKKEIILCKFYHTPGLTCTSRPCRFVHNLSSIQAPNSAYPNTASLSLSGFRMLSPTQPDPTFGTFAQAQMTPINDNDDNTASEPTKTIKVKDDGSMDLGDIMPGEKIMLQDENGEEVVGQVFFMSGGGKGAMGKSREKWKTVPCKDFAEGHCPYGDYCSFIHDEKLPAGILNEDPKAEAAAKAEEKPEEEKPVQRRLTHRKSASLSSSLTAWTKALPKAILVPSVKVDPQILNKKNEVGLSAFAPPFLKDPIAVTEAGDLVPALPSPKPQLPVPEDDLKKMTATTPPARAKEPIAIPMEPTITAPPKVAAWAKGPPPSLRKVASIKNLSLTSRQQHEDYTRNSGLTPPSSATGDNDGNHLMPPVSAFSMFGTESDPASPFDPVVQRRKLQELEDSINERERNLPKSNLSQQFDSDLYPPSQYHSSPPPSGDYNPINPAASASAAGNNIFNSTTYPWGMPMSPLPGYNDPSIPTIPGGLGVIWTPAGWAVQDAAMKNALRSAEVKARYGEDTKRRTAKNYFRTKPCRFFNEGFCPHGDECTYMHILIPSSPEQTSSSSGSDSGSISQTFSPIQMNPTLQPSAQIQLPFQGHSQGQVHPKHQTLPCKFYNSSLGCNNGDRCSFLHTRVVPESVALVERPRPWRTKPCRHYQLGRCTLGDACHFAHVPDPAWLNSGHAPLPTPEMGMENRLLTEESLEKTLQEMRINSSINVRNDEDDEDEDDVEIVTAVGDLTFPSANYSPPSSVRA